MIEETGKILSIEDDALWVEATQHSSCQSCEAEKGCGQNLLMKAATSGNTMVIRALLPTDNTIEFKVDDQVLIGIPEDVIVSSTMLLYLLPLLTMITGVMVGHTWSGNDVASALGGVFGLLIGGGLVRLHSWRQRNNTRVHPIVLKRLSTV